MSFRNFIDKNLNTDMLKEAVNSLRPSLDSFAPSLNEVTSQLKSLDVVEKSSETIRVAQDFLTKFDKNVAMFFGHKMVPINPNFNVLNLSDETIIEMSTYLDPGSICALLGTSKRAYDLIQRGDRTIWETHLLQDFRISFHPDVCNSSREMYLKCRHESLESEAAHYEAVKNSHPTLHSFHKMFPEFCVQLADFGYVKEEKLAKVLSLKRSYAMGTLLVNRSADIMAFKKAHQAGSPQNFLSLDCCHPDNFNPQTVMQSLPNIEFPGLIDYAIHLIELKEEHEKYRYSVLYTLMKNLLVFETEHDIREFATVYGAVPYAIALDSYSEEELNQRFPKFSWYGFRESLASKNPEEYGNQLYQQLTNTQLSLAHLRYNSLSV
mmetsp:Transcript_38670/g.50951  ORF Transcript_38670/g.50951 Transcript_38670/m.50951 type:complete len:379 (+) Transcript_38670:202-1338(+)